MEKQIFNWFVKKGNILIQKNEDCIFLRLDCEKGESCLLTLSDTEEIIVLLTSISKQIWESPDYVRTPYTKQLFQEIQNVYIWTINKSLIKVSFNEIERAIEVKFNGNNEVNIGINYMIEIIQVLEHLKKYCA